MIERFEPRRLAPDDVRIDFTMTDRGGDVVGLASKRFVGVWEDRRQGFRITVEGDSKEEVRQSIEHLHDHLFN